MRNALLSLGFILSLTANPSDPTVVSGQALFDTQNDLLQITAADRTIIEWKQFVIQNGETAQFIQPNARASVLNRVLDANPIQILGRLEGNGQIILINHNGMVVGSQGVIDVASLIASSLDIQNHIYLARGELRFDKPSFRPIIQHGNIIGNKGDVILIAHSIENDGSISAFDGRTALLAARSVTLDKDTLSVESGLELHFTTPEVSFLNSPLSERPMTLSVSSYDDKLPARVDHKGTGSIVSRQGNGLGGKVYLLGDDVWIQDSATVDVSGNKGGGSIHVGGGFRGSEEGIPNAKKTFVGKNTLLKADALGSGTGGRVIVWGDSVNQFIGQISAQGGPAGGNGGFAEVSSRMHLFFKGSANLLAPLGDHGMLSLDPTDINISSNPTSPGVILAPITTIPPFVSVDINNGDLANALNSSNISISTVTAGTGSGNITVTAPLDFTTVPIWTTGTSLTLMAERDILVLADISPLGSFPGDQIILISDLNNVGVGDVTIETSIVSTIEGSIRIEGNNVKVTSPSLGTEIFTALGGDINIVARNDFIAEGALGFIGMAADQQFNIFAGRDITINGSNGSSLDSDTSGMTWHAGRTITIHGADCIGCNLNQSFFANGPLLFSAGEDILMNAKSPMAGPTGLFSIMLWVNDSNSFTSFSTLNSLRCVGGTSFDNGVFFSLGSGVTGGDLILKAGGDLILCSPIHREFSGLIPPSNNRFDTSVTLLADHSFSTGELWAANSNGKLASTPLGKASGIVSTETSQKGGNGLGGFAVKNSFFDSGGMLNRTIPGGIIIETTDGAITIKTSPKFIDGTVCNFVASVTLDVSSVLPVQFITANGDITVDPPFNITVANPIVTGGSVFMIAQNDLSIVGNGSITAGGDITLVVDNQDPLFPFIGPGSFTLEASSFLTAGGGLRIYTALRGHNRVAGLLNGLSFSPGNYYQDTNTEQWCTYYPAPLSGRPYTIAYKDCLLITTAQAARITEEFLVDLHPYDEFPGWMERFIIGYSGLPEHLSINWEDRTSSAALGYEEPFYLRRRQLKVINHPKTWTQIAY